jgi:hypothetical protein
MRQNDEHKELADGRRSPTGDDEDRVTGEVGLDWTGQQGEGVSRVRHRLDNAASSLGWCGRLSIRLSPFLVDPQRWAGRVRGL